MMKTLIFRAIKTPLTRANVSIYVSSVMASVHLRPATPYYHAAFRGPDGRLILRSTKQTDRNSALAVALEYERAAKLAMRGELVEAQAREVVKGIMARADIGETIQTVSIADYFRQWLTAKEARKSAGTAERYGCVVDGFLASLGKREGKPLTALVARDVDAFLDARLKQGVSPSTACLDVRILRAALNAARRKGLIPTNPAEGVELPDVESMERGTFSEAEVKMLVDTAQGEWKTLILLAYYTGARLGDCCRMQWANFDLAGGWLTYTQAKTGHSIGVAIHPDLLTHLESLAGTDAAEPFVMPGMASRRVSGRKGLSESFKTIVRRAGLDLQTVKGGGVRMFSKRTFHSLRHSCNSELANKDVSSDVRQKITGHASKEMNRLYTHFERETIRAAIAKLPNITK
jgi:integrase